MIAVAGLSAEGGCQRQAKVFSLSYLSDWLPAGSRQIVRGTGFGLIADLCIGIIGALIGSWLLPRLGIHLGTGIVSAIISATIGAICFPIGAQAVNRRGQMVILT